MTDIVYSKRLGGITNHQFQAALARFNLGDFVRAEPVTSGLFGQNVFLTSTQGAFVLRGVPHYPWQFPTEQFITGQLCTKTNVPVAYPYLYEPSTDIFGWSFAIMPRLPGISIKDPLVLQNLTGDDRANQARELARMLVEVQRLSWNYPGKYHPDIKRVEPFDCGYREWVAANIRRKLSEARSYNDHTTDEDAQWIEEVIALSQPAFQEPYNICVVLGDYGEHNVLFQHEEGPAPGGEWKISAVFDLMTAHFGDGAADLSLSVAFYLKKEPVLAEVFVEAYLAHNPATPPSFAILQKLYMVDLLLSFWRYWQRESGQMPEDPEGRLDFRSYAGQCVSFWDKFA